ncbi:MAG: tetratricopeptide repeat-containing sensor histidine kinase [Bacteroidota bacterium]
MSSCVDSNLFNTSHTENEPLSSLYEDGLSLYKSKDYSGSENVANTLINRSKENDYLKGEGLGLYLKGITHRKQGKLVDALESLFKAAETWQKIGDPEFETKTQIYLGLIYKSNKSLEIALKHYSKAEQIALQTQDSSNLKSIYHNKAILFDDLEAYDSSLDYYFKSLKLREALGDIKKVANTYNNLASVYKKMQDIETAKQYYAESLKLQEQRNDLKEQGAVLNNIGLLYYDLDNLEEAKRYWDKSLEIRENVNDARGFSITYYNLGRFFIDTDQIENGLAYLDRSIELAESINRKDLLKDDYEALYEIHEQLGNTEESLRYYKKYAEIELQYNNDEIKELTIRRSLEEAHEKEEERVLQAAIEAQQVEILQWISFVVASIIALVIVSMLSWIVYQRYRYINHLMYSLAHDVRNPLSHITGASYLLKHAPETLDEQVTLINRTVKQIDNMLTGILERRHKRKFELSLVDPADAIENALKGYYTSASSKQIVIEPDIEPGNSINVNLPTYLQAFDNLMSNAIKYSPENSLVTVSIEKRQSELHLTVCDEGPGIPEDQEQFLFQEGSTLSTRPTGGESRTGNGLYITKRNIEAMGGELSYCSECCQGASFTISFSC